MRSDTDDDDRESSSSEDSASHSDDDHATAAATTTTTTAAAAAAAAADGATASGSPRHATTGRAGTLECRVLEARCPGSTGIRVVAEYSETRYEVDSDAAAAAAAAAAGGASRAATFGEAISFPVEVPSGYVYFRVLCAGYVGECVVGRACVSLNELTAGKASTTAWLELLPPAINEDVASRGFRVRALSPSVYKNGLPQTMQTVPTTPLGYIRVSLTWRSRPDAFSLISTDYDWASPLHPTDGLDWYGNLFIYHSHRISTAFTVPSILRASREAAMPKRMMILAGYMLFSLSVAGWMLPLAFFFCVLANAVYHHVYLEDDAPYFHLYEDENEFAAPTVLASLRECYEAPTSIKKGQDFLAGLASNFERVGYFFTYSDVQSKTPLLVLFFACASVSTALFYVPLRVFMLVPGWFVLFGPGTGSPEEKAKTARARAIQAAHDAGVELSSKKNRKMKKRKSKTGHDDGNGAEAEAAAVAAAAVAAEVAPDLEAPEKLLPDKPSLVSTIFRNAWYNTPDREEYVHRKTFKAQRVDAQNVPSASD